MTDRRTLWGQGQLPGALQPWLTVDGQPWLSVENVAWTTVLPSLTVEPWLLVDGETWLTVNSEAWLAIVEGSVPPAYWQTSPVAFDGNVPFGFSYETNAWQPRGQLGECVFAVAYIGVSWSAGAVIRVTPFTDGNRDAIQLPDGSLLEVVPVTFALAQQGGSLQRKTEVFAVPLVRRQVRGAAEIARYNLRGERLQFLIESTGQIGSGEMFVEGQAVEFEPVRKAIYAAVDAGG